MEQQERERSRSSAFGIVLRRLRLGAGLSLEEVAERARMSSNGVGALERGDRRMPQRETLTLLAAALELDNDQLRMFEAAARPGWSRRPDDQGFIRVLPGAGRSVSRLPLALTSFIGRRDELRDLTVLMRERRLVTLTGTGGIGKSRTALEFVGARVDGADSAVCFVELAPVGDGSLVAAAVATALGLAELPGRALIETLVAYLRHLPQLLVLDNCEHVIDDAARVTGALLRGCPAVRILATSREPLRVSGEHVYRLPPLTTPAPGVDISRASDAIEYSAIALFEQRARAADNRFALSDGNAATVVDVCRRLDGISLAIELAAARVRTLPVETMAARLDQRFAILSAGDRTALPRHQTMRALIDWSYDLLSPAEQRLFERLSVFAGGCTLENVTALWIAPAGAEDAARCDAAQEIFESLSALVDKSMVEMVAEGDEPRYRLLESARQYAREKLSGRSEVDSVMRAHSLACLAQAGHIDRSYWTDPDAVWRDRARAELDNWRGALEWALGARGDVATGQRLVAALKIVWRDFARREGWRWIGLAFEFVDADSPPDLVASLNLAQSVVANHFTGYNGQRVAAVRALERYRRLGDDFGMALAWMLAGHALVNSGRAGAGEPMLRAALSRARRLEIPGLLAATLRNLGCCLAATGAFDEARGAHGEALEIFTALGADLGAAHTREDLACLEFLAGNTELALAHAADALAACRSRNDIFGIVETGLHRAMWFATLGRYADAEVCARESLSIACEAQLDVFAATALENLAAVSILRDSERDGSERRSAARLLGFSSARLASQKGSQCDDFSIPLRDRALAALRAELGADALARLAAAGAKLTLDEAVRLSDSVAP